MSNLIDKIINLINKIIDMFIGQMVRVFTLIVLIILILVGSFLIDKICVNFSQSGGLCSLSSNILNYLEWILS
jgi:hypothetical protein